MDTLLELKDAGLLAASAAAQVGGSDQILDLGAGHWMGEIILDLTAIEVDTGDEIYEVGWQLSTKSDFADTIFEAATFKMGDATTVAGDADTAVGRYVFPVRNDYGGTVYRYARLYITIGGTIATGINFKAYAAKMG
jgi:hypothetical protein